MTSHRIGKREEWLAAAARLLERRKEPIRMGDEIARQGKRAPGPVPPSDVSTRQGPCPGVRLTGRTPGLAVAAGPSGSRALACSKSLPLVILAR